MPIAKTTLETFVSPDDLKAVLLDFESYPEFLPEVASVDVLARTDERVEVCFHIEISFAGFEVKSEYTVEYRINDNEITWDLVSSPSMTKNRGRWILEATEDDETRAAYEAEVETNLDVPPDVQALFIQESLPKLMEKFRDRAEDL